MTIGKNAFDAIIIGAGAAGLMCALTAGQRGRKVLLLEHTDKVGAKILISGGGRCNFTNLDCTPSRFLSQSPHFCRSALARYTQADFIDLVQRHGIAFHEKTLGQLFCDGSARDIVSMLLAECSAGNVEIRLNEPVTRVARPDRFSVETGSGVFTATSLVLATGGLSIPKMGATGFSYDLAKQFGLRLAATYPGLVPFLFGRDVPGIDASLAGVSLDAVTTHGKHGFRENILFTHRGLSGPAILQISSYWRPGTSISIDLVPGLDVKAFLLDCKRTHARSAPQSVLAEIVPTRLAQALTAAHLKPGELANQSDRALTDFAGILKCWTFQPSDTEGYAKAEVTCGGVDTRDLSSKTMEARNVPGLHVIGEAVDVTGWLGGYNFQWAWSSGWAAGQSV